MSQTSFELVMTLYETSQTYLERIYVFKDEFDTSNATQAHWKYVSLHTFLQHRNYVPCSTFRGSFKVKCPESGAITRLIRDRDTFLLRWYRHVLQCFYAA